LGKLEKYFGIRGRTMSWKVKSVFHREGLRSIPGYSIRDL